MPNSVATQEEREIARKGHPALTGTEKILEMQ